MLGNAVAITPPYYWNDLNNARFPTDAPFTFASAFNRSISAGGNDVLIGLDSDVANHWFSFYTTNNGVLRLHNRAGGTGTQTLRDHSGLSEGTWYFAGAGLDSNADWAIWANDGETTGNTAYNSPTDIDSLIVGDSPGAAEFQGDMLYAAVYDVFLSPEERAALGKGIHPLKIRPQNLVSLVIFVGTTAIDLRDGPMNAVTGGSVSETESGLAPLLTGSRILIPPSAGGGTISLVVAAANHAHSADQPALSQAVSLTLAETLHGQTAELVGLVQAHQLGMADAAHGHTVDELTLSEGSTLSVAEASHEHAAEVLGLIQKNTLALEEALHAHSVESITLAAGEILDIADTLHSHGADTIELSQAGMLVVLDALHSHQVDNVALSQAVILAVTEALHAHSVTSPVLSETTVLQVEDTLHAVDGDTIELTQRHVLVVSEALHAHLVGAISLRIPGVVNHSKRILTVKSGNRTYIVARGNREVRRMKIKVTITFKHDGHTYTEGDELTVDDAIGTYFCTCGWAERLDGQTPPEDPPTETVTLEVEGSIIGHAADKVGS